MPEWLNIIVWAESGFGLGEKKQGGFSPNENDIL